MTDPVQVCRDLLQLIPPTTGRAHGKTAWSDLLTRAQAVVDAAANRELSPWDTHMRTLLGKQVRVVLQYEPKEIAVTGTLLWFEDSGEVMLRDEDDGHVSRAWPNLDTQAVPV